jgi:DNA replication protein DnaC
MQDTSSEMQKKQYEVFFRLSPEERVKQGVEMINVGLMIVENSIKNQYPNISKTDFKIEKLKRLYKNDLSEAELQRIIQHFRDIGHIEKLD